jgi:hypothetical protein
VAWIGLGLLAFSMIGAAAELSYRAVVVGQLRALERNVLSRHPEANHEATYHTRFANEVSAPDPSLFGDLVHLIGRRSRGITWGYTTVWITFRRGSEEETFGHAFLWSPRVREFVHFDNWGTSCNRGCPWGRHPNQIGR